MIGLGWNAWSSTDICLDGVSGFFLCAARGVENGSDCVTLFLFLLLSTLVKLTLVEFLDDFEIPASEIALVDCLFFGVFVDTGDVMVSFAVHDFFRCIVGLTAC